MRLIRNKVNRKTMHFFGLTYKIFSPYRVLLDGNFIAVAERLKLEWKRLLPKLLFVDEEMCHLHITECTLKELLALPASFAEAKEVARSLPVIKCRHKHGHTEGMNAHDCIKKMVGEKNEGKWIVVTQDSELRNIVREVPGTPIVLISNNVLILEPPSEASKKHAHRVESDRSALNDSEKRALKSAMKDLGSELPKSYLPINPTVALPSSKAPKAPNPLSVMKRKREDDHHPSLPPDNGAPKKKNRRKTK